MRGIERHGVYELVARDIAPVEGAVCLAERARRDHRDNRAGACADGTDPGLARGPDGEILRGRHQLDHRLLGRIVSIFASDPAVLLLHIGEHFLRKEGIVRGAVADREMIGLHKLVAVQRIEQAKIVGGLDVEGVELAGFLQDRPSFLHVRLLHVSKSEQVARRVPMRCALKLPLI
jgi:hypothetical protein